MGHAYLKVKLFCLHPKRKELFRTIFYILNLICIDISSLNIQRIFLEIAVCVIISTNILSLLKGKGADSSVWI